MTDTQTPADTRSVSEPLPYSAIRHPKCGQYWTGLTRAHCPSCCRTFSCDSAAGQHRKGPYGGGRHCVDPATVGLAPVDKSWGVMWQNPGPDGGMAAARHGGPGGEQRGPETYIAEESGGCATCGYDYGPGEEIGDVNGEINCVGCFDRAVDAGIV